MQPYDLLLTRHFYFMEIFKANPNSPLHPFKKVELLQIWPDAMAMEKTYRQWGWSFVAYINDQLVQIKSGGGYADRGTGAMLTALLETFMWLIQIDYKHEFVIVLYDKKYIDLIFNNVEPTEAIFGEHTNRAFALLNYIKQFKTQLNCKLLDKREDMPSTLAHNLAIKAVWKLVPPGPRLVDSRENYYNISLDEDSKWRNPHSVKAHSKMGWKHLNMQHKAMAAKYEKYLFGQIDLLNDLKELKGKILGCSCYNPERPWGWCHGDYLLKYANMDVLEVPKEQKKYYNHRLKLWKKKEKENR